MTLDEAIRHAEEVADICEYDASKWDITDAYEQSVACGLGKCAEEHRQLVEWLKDYKKLKEKEEPKRPIINRGFVLCPSCDICIRYPIADKYTRCPYCGQALKWENEE